MLNKLQVYNEYLEARKKATTDLKITPYDWEPTGKISNPNAFIYFNILKEHSRELSNTINWLGRTIKKLEAWDIVMKDTPPQEKLSIVIEFVDDIATSALTLPYVIRSRFIFSIAHLSHQANRTHTGWVDDLPNDEDIFFKDADTHADGWKAYKKLKKN